METPLIEQPGDATGSASSATQEAATGPSVTFSPADGSTVTLGAEDLQLLLLAIQTFLLLYVTYAEVSR